jgi:hypothetical protein
LSPLTALVEPHHLTDDAVAAYRSEFQSSPARHVVLKDFLKLAVAERLSRFLDTEAEYATEHGLFGIDQGVDEHQWNAADESSRFFRFSKLVGTQPQYQLSENALTYLRFRSTFQTDAELRGFFAAITGMDLGASDDFGSHSMRAGDFLKHHDDDNRNRVLALVLYLSPEWKREYGGTLKIVEPSGSELTVDATYNSLVAFDTRAGTSHYVVPISPDAGTRKRLTIGGWYHEPAEQ